MKTKKILIIFFINISIFSCAKESTFRFQIRNETDQGITLVAYYLGNPNSMEMSERTIESKVTEIIYNEQFKGDIPVASVLESFGLPQYFDLPLIDSLCINFNQDGKKLCFRDSDINQPELNILFNEFDESSGWSLTDTYVIDEKHRVEAR